MSLNESPVKFNAPDQTSLEGKLSGDLGSTVALLCHPHSLYGGNMDNNVVLAARDTFYAQGIGTLRFNFRGVGASEGSFDEGCGEANDIKGAFNYLKEVHQAKEVYVAAYSFGSWVFLMANQENLGAAKVVLISPPVSFLDFSGLALPNTPTKIIVGENDEYCSSLELNQWLESESDQQRNADLTVLPSVNHFYGGAETLLGEAIQTFFSK